TKHDKLPDVVLYDETRNWLFLIEAVTSHGPVSPKRKLEMERALKSCTAERIYVSAFPDFKEFRRHIDNIAWETEVWIAENPDHMIHFNGDKFLGPTSPPSR
ncbi:MAG: BsuBI/PstI family type II restriction endonuclease, partial [bacterium]